MILLPLSVIPFPHLNQRFITQTFSPQPYYVEYSTILKTTNYCVPRLQVARYSAGKQRDDGSWSYGELPNQSWIDNFHTGYNLSALRAIDRYLGTSEFEPYARRGFAFYRDHFFREDGAVRYFHNRTYPIDIHCVAQSILTLLEFQDLDSTNLRTVDLVYDWTMSNMWDKAGFFYYRMLRMVRFALLICAGHKLGCFWLSRLSQSAMRQRPHEPTNTNRSQRRLPECLCAERSVQTFR